MIAAHMGWPRTDESAELAVGLDGFEVGFLDPDGVEVRCALAGVVRAGSADPGVQLTASALSEAHDRNRDCHYGRAPRHNRVG